MMKLRISTLSTALVLALSLALLLTGCNSNQSGGTIEEPEITVKYLTTEYKAQLIRDGAQELLGSIEFIQSKDKTSELLISEKVIVENTDYEEGYYIADKNNLVKGIVDSETRVTYIDDETGKEEVSDITALYEAVKKDNIARKDKLYNIYLMGEQVVLILACDSP